MDCLVIGAHPDDAEIFAGGLIARCAQAGRSVGILHLTRGECGTRGTAEERRAEAAESAHILGLPSDHMRMLDLGDARLENTEANRLAIIRIVREWRPRLVIHHDTEIDRHPDHGKAGALARDAVFYSRLKAFDTGQPPFAPGGRMTFQYNGPASVTPTMVVDISDTFATKMDALRAYRSQFYNPSYAGEETYISSREFMEQIEVRARFFGGLIGVRYGEPFWATAPLLVRDPLLFFPEA